MLSTVASQRMQLVSEFGFHVCIFNLCALVLMYEMNSSSNRLYPTCTHRKESEPELAMPPAAKVLQQFKPASLPAAVGLDTS